MSNPYETWPKWLFFGTLIAALLSASVSITYAIYMSKAQGQQQEFANLKAQL